jgi:hypothetical protein
MSILDKLSSAETSSDLQHHAERLCDIDIIGAAGLAASSNPLHMALYRVKYLHDMTELDQSKRIFILWSRRIMLKRKLNPASANRIGVQALKSWLHDVCLSCNGQKYQVVPGTPSLSDKPCQRCSGTGRNNVTGPGNTAEIFKDLMDKADQAVRAIEYSLNKKLG